jgi:hypothetical protein
MDGYTPTPEHLDQVHAFIKGRDWVTYVELQRFVESLGLPGRGDMTACSPDYPSIFFYQGLSDELLDIIDHLAKDKRIVPAAACTLTYMIDGGVLALPLAKRVMHYKTPRWFPICFRDRERAEADKPKKGARRG